MVVEEESAGANAADARETSPANIVALKSQASTVRDQILAEERAASDDKVLTLRSITYTTPFNRINMPTTLAHIVTSHQVRLWPLYINY